MQENFQSFAMYDISENFPPPEVPPENGKSSRFAAREDFSYPASRASVFCNPLPEPRRCSNPNGPDSRAFGAQFAPRLPNILRCAAERRPLTEEILSFPRFRGIKGRLSSRLSRAACANTKIFSARAEYILWADRRRRPEILSRNCIRAGPLSILCRLSAPRTT